MERGNVPRGPSFSRGKSFRRVNDEYLTKSRVRVRVFDKKPFSHEIGDFGENNLHKNEISCLDPIGNRFL